MYQQNQIISHIFIGTDDFVIEFGKKRIILQLAIAQTKQEFLSAAFCFTGKGKFQIQKILADGTGKRLAQQFKILKDFFLGKREKRLLKFCFLIFFTVHITAADSGDRAVAGRIESFDFIDFGFDHKLFLLCKILLGSG